MNNKLFFYIYVLIITFLSVNIFKHYTNGSDINDYLIYVLLALGLFSIIVNDLIALFTGQPNMRINDIVTMMVYLIILALSVYGIQIAPNTFDTVFYIGFLIMSLLFIIMIIIKLRQHKK